LNYNEAQLRAIQHMDGPAFVLAGPGSGKTAVLTRRVLHLVENGISPSDILVITFTRAAAEEMKARYLLLAKRDSTQVTFGTFHAVFFHILRHEYGYEIQDLITSGEKQRILRGILRSLKIECDRDLEKLQEIESAISKWKNLGMAEEEKLDLPQIQEIYQLLADKMRRQRKLDFDDMQLFTYELFRQKKEILEKWQRKYKYILVDEFQDINPIQYEIVRMLALPENNLFIVGDDDQSIYGFRGSKPEIMLNFPKEYPGAEKIMLEINYRCQKEIVKAAKNLISYNTERYDKDIQSGQKEEGKVEILEFPSQEKEAEEIAEQIRRRLEAGQEAEEITILFRTRLNARYMIRALEEKNVPYYMEGKIPDLYAHWIAKDLEAYLLLAAGEEKRAHLFRILNRPARGLGREFLEEEIVDFQKWRRILPAEEAKAAERLLRDLERMKKMTCYAQVSYISHGIGYKKFLREYAAEKKIEEEELFETFSLLCQEAKKHRSIFDWKEEVKLKRLRQQNESQDTEGKISLRSLHGSKGLEFDTVYIMESNEGIIPYKKSVDEGKTEEERRLLYVGMTRAKKELYLSFADQIRGRKSVPSGFFKECEKYNAEEEK
jgi:DNA helicase II / ATP-dependent DNA helicase PcrA